jgi:hypothetical protein
LRHSAGGVAEDRAFIWYCIGRVYAQKSCSSVEGQEWTDQMLIVMTSYSHDCQPSQETVSMTCPGKSRVLLPNRGVM